MSVICVGSVVMLLLGTSSFRVTSCESTCFVSIPAGLLCAGGGSMYCGSTGNTGGIVMITVGAILTCISCSYTNAATQIQAVRDEQERERTAPIVPAAARLPAVLRRDHQQQQQQIQQQQNFFSWSVRRSVHVHLFVDRIGAAASASVVVGFFRLKNVSNLFPRFFPVSFLFCILFWCWNIRAFAFVFVFACWFSLSIGRVFSLFFSFFWHNLRATLASFGLISFQ